MQGDIRFNFLNNISGQHININGSTICLHNPPTQNDNKLPIPVATNKQLKHKIKLSLLKIIKALMKKFENILVAFDLNKTLFFKSQSPLPMRHHSKISRYYFYPRPHLTQLIDFLHLNDINYCFWSNMMGKNCVKYVNELKGLGMAKSCGIFDQQFCDWDVETEEGEKVRSVKNLHKLAALFEIDTDNCILVDDSKEKSVEGCHLIHIDSYLGQQVDKQLLLVIEELKQFRHSRVNLNQKLLPKLPYTEYKFQSQLDNIAPPKIKYVQKKTQPTQIELFIEKDPQLKKFKTDLIAQKENKKSILKEIQTLEQNSAQMAQELKIKSQGKSIRKGDDLLLEVLTFAKKKKMVQKKLEQLKEKKRNSQEKIALLKKLMRAKVKELNPNSTLNEEEETKEEKQKGEVVKKVKNKKKKSQQKGNEADEKGQAEDEGEDELKGQAEYNEKASQTQPVQIKEAKQVEKTEQKQKQPQK